MERSTEKRSYGLPSATPFGRPAWSDWYSLRTRPRSTLEAGNGERDKGEGPSLAWMLRVKSDEQMAR